MSAQAFSAFLFLLVLSVWGSTDVTFIMMKRIGIEKSRYPQCYIARRRWMKKIFKIRRKMIPRFIYVELYIIVAFVLLFPINLIVCSKTGDKDILIFYNLRLFYLNIAYIVIGTDIFRKKF